MKNIVTISREYGSGGYEVGRRVAERMNYKFYDKELIAHIADKFLIPESFVAATEETELKKKNIFHEVFPVFTRTENENADYIFREQGKFIVQLVEEGNCVIAGRRADYYLKDNPRRPPRGLLSEGQPERLASFLLCRSGLQGSADL